MSDRMDGYEGEVGANAASRHRAFVPSGSSQSSLPSPPFGDHRLSQEGGVNWSRYDPADYQVGDPLFIADGYNTPTVQQYTVTKISAKGQVTAERDFGDGQAREIRVSAKGAIFGAAQWDRRRIVSASRAREITAQAAERAAWNAIRNACSVVDKAARDSDPQALAVAMGRLCAAARRFTASVDERPQGQDPEEGLGATPASAVPSEETADAHPHSGPSHDK